MIWLNFRETVKNVYFGVIALAGVLFFVATSTTAGSIFGTTTWPVTWQMLELVSGTFSVFMLVIVTFYAGELVWREREHRLDQIHDALPIPTWLPFVAKLGALMLVPVVLQAVLMLSGIAIQTAKGYHHYEPGLYLRWLFGLELVDYWLVCVLALVVHSIVNQKYLGHFVMIVYFIVISFAPLLGLEHNLYLYGSNGGFVYSDMNGFGHFLFRVRTFQAYWAAVAVLLALAGYLMWVRGTTVDWKGRLALARGRLTPGAMALGPSPAWRRSALGGFIFWNTNVLNPYVTVHGREARQADYEKKYKALAADPQPKITAVSLKVDLYPQEQRVRVQGSYGLENRSGKPVDVVHLLFFQGERLRIHRLELGVPAKLETDDLPIGVRSYRLASPLAPGASTTLAFDLEVPTRGFANTGSTTDVVYNGSFVNGMSMLPLVGYQERGELATDRDRKKFGLAPKERMRDRDDPAGLAENALAPDADFIAFDADVGTDRRPDGDRARLPGARVDGERPPLLPIRDGQPDPQLLLVPVGALRGEEGPVERRRDRDLAPARPRVQPRPHDRRHEGGARLLHRGVRPVPAPAVPHRRVPALPDVRAVVPQHHSLLRGIGFIARVRDGDPDDIDYPYYVTAHEIAHQWWGHQVVGGNVQGETMLVETLAQYSALMVMKQKYGAAKMRRFLRHELDRYLIGRGTEQKKELPLGRVENQQYIHYRKGSLVMYALQDYIGEENLNRAIRAYRDEWAFKGPPYSSASHLIARIRAVTPPELRYMIDDLFETITLYDNRALSAKAKALPDGRYEVALKVYAKKRKADALGKEDDVPLADWIDIGVLDADDDPLFLEKRKITQGETEFTLVVAKKPAKAGIDPYNKLIDRRPKDNAMAVAID